MNSLFYCLATTGAIVSILILIVLLMTPLFNRRYHKIWRFRVWIVFSLFLILPVGLLFQLMPENGEIVSGIVHNASIITPMSSSADAATFKTITEIHKPSFFLQLLHSAPEWIPIVWLIGVIAFTLFYLTQYYHFKLSLIRNSNDFNHEIVGRVQSAFLLKDKRIKKVKVFESPKIPGPMIIGILTPMVVIPKREYQEQDLELILSHEFMHYVRRDMWTKGIALFALILHWYNPIIHVMAGEMSKDMEHCCDYDIVKGQTREFRSHYSDIIMNEALHSIQRRKTLFACMGGDKTALEMRLKSIFDRKKRKGTFVFILAALMIISACGYAFAKEEKPPEIFQTPEYKQLLETVIADKTVADKARLEKLKRFNNRAYEDIPNYDELVNLVSDADGNYDELDVYRLAGVEPPDYKGELRYLEELMSSYFMEVNNSIEPHILERAVYAAESGEPWKLKKGDTVKAHIYADINRLEPAEYKGKGALRFGYVRDEEYIDVEEFFIKEEKQVEFEIPEDGEYNFYIFCPASSSIIIKWVSIDIK